MNRERISDRATSMQYCYDISKYLTDTPLHPFPVSAEVAGDASAVESARDDHHLRRVTIAHLLNVTVFELGIKMLWEIDKGSKPSNTHNITALFECLSDSTKRHLKNLYEDTRARLIEHPITHRDGQPAILGDLIAFQSLDEALKANEDTIKNFKYDMQVRGKSTVLGGLWWNLETGLMWARPPGGPSFVDALYAYVNNRVAQCGEAQG